MKKFLTTLSFMTIILAIIFMNRDITTFILKNTIYKREMAVQTPNSYQLKTEFQYVKNIEQKEPQNKEELFRLIYTILNNGFDQYTFFCPSSYQDCLQDVKKMTSDKILLSHFNNFVHPYNSYNKMVVHMNSFGKVSLSIEKLYTEEQRIAVDQEIDRIMKEILTDEMTIKNKILTFHDYIVNTTVYDKKGAEKIKKEKFEKPVGRSHLAYGTLFDHLSLCGGYSDTMAIFLTKLGVPNMKVANNEHVWNLVQLDGVWYHLDLTWDDPVVDTGENILLHNFFLISTAELHQKDAIYHNFDSSIYIEAQSK